MKYNLFTYATSELSHSALWAWALQCTESKSEPHFIPRKVGEHLLKFVLDNPELEIQKIEVNKEYTPKGLQHVRFDIHALINDSLLVIIENKVKSIPTKKQLNRYRSLLSRRIKTVKLVLLNCNYDFDFEVPEGWLKIGLVDIIGLLEQVPEVASHAILSDYKSWLLGLKSRFEQLEENIWSHDIQSVKASLKEPEGQWYFLKAICQEFSGDQYRGVNRSGSPWTQFRFFGFGWDDERKAKFPDSLFYRVDSSSKGFYLSLRQHLNIKYFTEWLTKKRETTRDMYKIVDSKRHRLSLLQRLFKESILAVKVKKPQFNLQFEKPRKRGANESEIGWLIIGKDSRYNYSLDIKRWLSLVHTQFVEGLRGQGWPVG